jgi:hypothetical protein
MEKWFDRSVPIMSNVVAFRPRGAATCEATPVERNRHISHFAAEQDGGTFARAADQGWLSDELAELTRKLAFAVRSVGVDAAASETKLPLAFVRGFADQLASSRKPGAGSILTTQLSYTNEGLAEDTFYWLNENEASEPS